jgi:hypothetical protein
LVKNRQTMRPLPWSISNWFSFSKKSLIVYTATNMCQNRRGGHQLHEPFIEAQFLLCEAQSMNHFINRPSPPKIGSAGKHFSAIFWVKYITLMLSQKWRQFNIFLKVTLHTDKFNKNAFNSSSERLRSLVSKRNWIRVARFFSVQLTKTGKNIPNGYKYTIWQ